MRYLVTRETHMYLQAVCTCWSICPLCRSCIGSTKFKTYCKSVASRTNFHFHLKMLQMGELSFFMPAWAFEHQWCLHWNSVTKHWEFWTMQDIASCEYSWRKSSCFEELIKPYLSYPMLQYIPYIWSTYRTKFLLSNIRTQNKALTYHTYCLHNMNQDHQSIFQTQLNIIFVTLLKWSARLHVAYTKSCNGSKVGW